MTSKTIWCKAEHSSLEKCSDYEMKHAHEGRLVVIYQRTVLTFLYYTLYINLINAVSHLLQLSLKLLQRLLLGIDIWSSIVVQYRH